MCLAAASVGARLLCPALPSCPAPALLQDLDPALISRFSTSVTFGLPSESCRLVQVGPALNVCLACCGAAALHPILPSLLPHRCPTSACAAQPNPMPQRTARLPACRADILKQYARHLSDAEVLAVASATPGMAGRDLKDVCEQAERRWASKVCEHIGRRVVCSRGHVHPPTLTPS